MFFTKQFALVLSFILFIQSCSTTSNTKFDFPANEANINKFKELDSDDPDYIVYASKLIDDLVQQTIAALKSKNSGRALKTSSIGVNLFPFRSDLIDLKKRSIKRFLETTKKMVHARSYSCNEIRDRIKFLKTFAPDQIINITQKNCSLKKVRAFEIKNLMSLIKVNENQFHQADMKYSTGIERDLDQILKKNKKLPLMDVLVSSLNYLAAFRIDLTNFQIDPDTEDDQNIILYTNDVDEELPYRGEYYFDGAFVAASILTFGIGFLLLIDGNDEPNNYCSKVCDSLEVKNTSSHLQCKFEGGSRGKSCSTSKSILQHSKAIFNEAWLPRFVVMKITGTTDKGKIENFLIYNTEAGRYSYRYDGVSSIKNIFSNFSPRDYQMFGSNNQQTQQYWQRYKRNLIYHNVDNGMPFLGPVKNCRLGEYCLYGMKREVVKSLKHISVQIDTKSTLQLMGNYWNEYLKIIRSNKNGQLTKQQREELGNSLTKIFLDLEKRLKRPADQGL